VPLTEAELHRVEDRDPERVCVPELLKEEDTVAQELAVDDALKEELTVPLMHLDTEGV
jgi:hypothetical protein